ncbi:hypothetical protein IEE_05223 [Bacillus cereus BAG5X1-1]|uniref:Uncharacterized protein n=1 Tax=Bacillus cereus BAG5X1-1 TaxID=1053189 RepID=J8A2P3_BACCE|nr:MULTISPECIES: type I polyketide synthase [Bacillus cereus group]EJQ37437.1 hypothetical protein IEE_05223 [Bacillus cereus BAG5X1-1]PEU19702.1 type I polyketide synthase [Bacillus wiedmannii]
MKEIERKKYLNLLKDSLQTIKKLKTDLEEQRKNKEPIAVIGMGFRFPGGCQDPQRFWEFLANGSDGIVEVPIDRWCNESFYDPNPEVPGKIYLKEAGFLKEDISEFDARFFGISPREAVEMDPQQRLLLEVSWEALERAGISATQIKGTQTGVFMGIIGSEYGSLPRKSKEINPYRTTGSLNNIASGRISYFLGVHGPSISIDTACSSSLVSIHLACESLQRGECKVALAGGSNLLLSPHTFASLCELRALSKDGRCKTFDASGDGYGRGEGVGVVVLKRLSDAIRDKDPILAVIRGTGVNQDGPGSGLTVPNGVAQKELIKKTLKECNILPNEISYFEAHGTGTALGDPIEVQSLVEVFGNDNERKKPLIIGSVKSNIGHLEGAAGISSLIKVILCSQNKKIPPNLHLNTINPRLSLEKIPATIPTELIPWETEEKPRISGINSFGFSGTNAHVIVSEAPDIMELVEDSNHSYERPLHMLTLSAKDENALAQLVVKYKNYFDNENGEKLQNICFTANAGRTHFSHRITFINDSSEGMKDKISKYINNKLESGIVLGSGNKNVNPKLTFLFNGQINQKIISTLLETQPTFHQNMQLCDRNIYKLIGKSFLDSASYSTEYMNEVLSFSFQYSLYKLWEGWGVKPNAVLGTEVGEFVAACAAGIMTIETALLYILESHGVLVKTNKGSLTPSKIRIISGNTGLPVVREEAVSNLYWETVLNKEPNLDKGIKYLQQKHFKHFLGIGVGIEGEDILHEPDSTYFPSLSASNPWGTLTNVLANLYCLGLNIDWLSFDQYYSRHKVILPTYPFQKKRFWCETLPFNENNYVREEIKIEKSKKSVESFLNGEVINSPMKEKQVQYYLDLDVLPELKDTHGVLHVGYYLEFLSRAIKKIYNQSFHVKSVEFMAAIILSESEQTNLSLVLSPKEDGEIEFTFYSSQEIEKWSKHTYGTVQLNKKNKVTLLDSKTKSEIKRRCNKQCSGMVFYQGMEKRGLKLGESVRWIESLWSGEQEVLARFKIPSVPEIYSEYEMGVHPGVFDACAQLFHETVLNDDMRYMVFKWEDIVFNNNLENQELWCHAVLQNSSQNGNLEGIFKLFNQNGDLVAQISRGFMKGISKEREHALKRFLGESENLNWEQSESEILEHLKSLNLNEYDEIIRNYLHEVFSSILNMALSELDINESLMDLGMDSLVGIEAKKMIEKDLNISLPMEILIQGPSIQELVKSLIPMLMIKKSEVERENEENIVLNKIGSEYKKEISSWIVHRKPISQPKIKLFCFPYGSGGGASLYRNWQEKMPNFIEVCPIQLPGKENRIKEKPINHIDQAVEILKQVIQPELDCPYAFYGHSIGALIAYRLAYKLWKDVDNKPIHLFAGAYTSPIIQPNPVITLTREKFKAIGMKDIPHPDILASTTPEQIRKIQDVFEVFLEETGVYDEELSRLLLPTRLSDLHLVQSYNCINETTFDVPITAIHGKDDNVVSEQDMLYWNKLTNGGFKIHTIPGDHFFLHENQSQKQLLNLISWVLESHIINLPFTK